MTDRKESAMPTVDDVRDYLDRAIGSFDRDPPKSDHQAGFLAGMKLARVELFGEPASSGMKPAP
jgi:hypothetical protein